MNNIRLKNIYAIYFIIIGITYSSLVYSEYAFLDDYDSLFYSLSGQGSTFKWDILSGRPLYALFRDFSQQFITGIEAFSYIRLFSITTIFIYCAYLYYFLDTRNIFRNKVYGYILPLFLVLNPSIVVYASWATCYPFVIALILAGLSYQILTSNLKVWGRFTLSLFVLSCSFSIYQPAALTFLYFVFLDNCLTEKKICFKSLFFSFAILFLGLIIAYVMAKYLPLFMYGEVLSRASIVTNPIEKIHWFLSEPFINVINNFNISPNVVYTLVSLMIILFSVYNLYPRKEKILKIILSILLFVATYIPNLIVSENWAAFRSMIGMELFIISFFVTGVFSIIDKITKNRLVYYSFFLFIVIASVQNNIFYGFIRQQQGEYQAMAQEISNVVPKDFKGKLYFDITDPVFSIYTKTQRYDEFGNISSATSWAPAGMALSIKHIKGFNFSIDKVVTPRDQIKCNNDCIIIKLSDSMRKSGVYW